MAIPFLDNEDGYKKVIDQIMELERTRLTRLETNVTENDLRKTSLDEITEQFTMVSNYGRELYGLNSVFRTTTANSSQPDVVEALVDGPIGNNEKHIVEVSQLATAQSISSKPIRGDLKLPASTIIFKMADEEIPIDFTGGNVTEFLQTLNTNENFSTNIKTRIVRKNEKESVVTFTSLKDGFANRIQLQEDSGRVLTTHLRMFQRNSSIETPLLSISDTLGQLSLQGKNKMFVNEKILLLPGKEVELTIGKEIDFNEVEYIAYRVKLPQKEVQQGTENTKINYSTNKNIEGLKQASNTQTTGKVVGKISNFPNQESLTAELTHGSSTNTNNSNTKDSVTNTPNNKKTTNSTQTTSIPKTSEMNGQQELTEAEKKTILAKLTYFKIPSESTTKKNIAWQRTPTLLQKEITRKDVSFDTIMLPAQWLDASEANTRSVYLDKLTLTNAFQTPIIAELPRTLMQRKNSDHYRPENEISAPQNAKLVYENIEVERSNNTVNDLIPGISLQLKKTSSGPINFSSSLDSTLIYERIIGFFNAYNQAIELLNIAISPDEESLRSTEFTENEEKKIGLFNGDYNFFRLKETIRNLVNKPYPAAARGIKDNPSVNEELKLLVQLGVKRIFSIQNPYDIDNDKVDIDLKKLKTSISIYGNQISAFFGADENGDTLPDSGIAYELETTIRSYFQRGGYFSLIGERLTTETRSLKKDIDSETTRLEERETSLKSDFGRVEAAMQEQENIDNYFKQFNQQ